MAVPVNSTPSWMNRVGGKYTLRDSILGHFPPPDEIHTYVEPFCGSCKVFLRNTWKYPVEVLNDNDQRVFDLLWTVQKITIDDVQKMDYTPDKELFYSLLKSAPCTAPDLFYKLSYTNIGSYGNSWVSMGSYGNSCGNLASLERYGPRIIRDIPVIQERLKGVHVCNYDYEHVLDKYNHPDSFVYADPPYYNLNNTFYRACKDDDFGHVRLFKCLSKFKGRWLMTYNDHPFIRELYTEYTINVLYSKFSFGRNGPSMKPTLLISNYLK